MISPEDPVGHHFNFLYWFWRFKKKKKVEQFQHFEASFFFFLLDFMCYVC